jgi:hypothetical protein
MLFLWFSLGFSFHKRQIRDNIHHETREKNSSVLPNELGRRNRSFTTNRKGIPLEGNLLGCNGCGSRHGENKYPPFTKGMPWGRLFDVTVAEEAQRESHLGLIAEEFACKNTYDGVPPLFAVFEKNLQEE